MPSYHITKSLKLRECSFKLHFRRGIPILGLATPIKKKNNTALTSTEGCAFPDESAGHFLFLRKNFMLYIDTCHWLLILLYLTAFSFAS